MREITQTRSSLTADRKVVLLDRSEDSCSETFVGRHGELTTLGKLLKGSGRPTRSAFVEGEAGIGKTRLVEEVSEFARQNGIRVLQGCCYQVPDAGPFLPFLQVLSQLRLSDPSSENSVVLLADGALGHGNWGGLTDDVRARRARFLRSLSETILREAASEETLLCIEDIQWADVGSLLVLNNLLDIGGHGLTILCTARTDEPMEVELRLLLARIEQKSRRIVLRGLGRREVREFVRNLVGPGHMTEEELQHLESFTNGNPMFLRELVLHLQETGMLERHSVPEAISRSRTPDRLTHVIDLRLRSLHPRAYQTLSVCSVIGMEFSADLVARAKDEPPTIVEGDVESAVRKGILKPVGRLDAPSYQFVHPLFAMSLYHGLSPSQRRDLHRRVAGAAHSSRLPLSVNQLAHHHALGFGAAGGQRAVGYCRTAAEQAERLLAFETAARFWELALRCTRPRSRRTRAELYRRLGRALWAANNWTRAAEAWGEALCLFESLKQRRLAGELALALGDIFRWRQELGESERWLERALGLPLSREDRGRALALLGSIRCLRDEPAEGLRLLEASRNILGTDGADPLVAFWMSYGFLTSGNSTEAYAVAKEGLHEASRRGDAHSTSLLAASLVHHELSNLRLGQARSYARMVEDAADPTDATALVYSLVCKSLVWGYAGMWQRVVRLCERQMARVRLAGRFQLATARLIWAEANLELGNAEVAEKEILWALPELQQLRPVGGLHLARALLLLGRDKEAASLLHRYSDRVRTRPRHAPARALLGEVASALDMPEVWRDCYDSLKGEPRPILVGYCAISVQRVLGRLATRLKLWAKAVEHFDTALQQLTQGRARSELVQTYLDYAEMRRARRYRGDLRKATALEMQAQTIVDELGIQRAAAQRAPSPPTDHNRFGLTGRELEVLTLVAKGRNNPEIAEALVLSRRTVERHLENIFGKMGIDSRTGAIMRAVEEGLVGPLARSSDAGDGVPMESRRVAIPGAAGGGDAT